MAPQKRSPSMDPIHEPVRKRLRRDAKDDKAKAAPNRDVKEALLAKEAPVKDLTEEDLEEGLLRKPDDVDKDQQPCDDTPKDDIENALEKPGDVDKEQQPCDDTHPTGLV